MNDERIIPPVEEQEIDLVELVRKLWANRRLILRTACAFFALGVAVALLSSKAYTASSVFVPQTGKKSASGGMASLAAMAGISLGSMGGEEVLSPNVYPNIMQSAEFLRELGRTPLRLEGYDTPVTLTDYLTLPEYEKFSLGGTILKYTVGLPGVILGAVRGEKEPGVPAAAEAGIVVLTAQEQKAARAIAQLVTLSLNVKEGYLTLTAEMPEAYAAAQVAESATQLLQRYVTEFKIEKVQANLDFVQERYEEVKAEYEKIQARRAAYRDANQLTATSRARTELERLDNQYNLSFAIYSELAKQVEQAKISVKETTPILTVISPVTVPEKATKPKRSLIVAGMTFFGLLVGCGLVFLFPVLYAVTGNERWRRFVREPGQAPAA